MVYARYLPQQDPSNRIFLRYLKISLSIFIKNKMIPTARQVSPFFLQAAISSVLAICLTIILPTESFGVSDCEKQNFIHSIIDYRRQINPLFKKISRQRTRYIIVHTSECDLKTTLKIVSKGKQDNYKWITRGGHTHYVIARNGQTYLILDDHFRANHAGISMWNGQTNISRISVGIELVAYHNGKITSRQYQSVRFLLDIIKKKYGLCDIDILTHSQVAYARPNDWKTYSHRGRKHCARNFNRMKAGLGPTWPNDPDVRAGRLQPDPVLTEIFYGKTLQKSRKSTQNVITRDRTVWSIAGNKYDSPNTLYRFPDGLFISGNRVGERVGWHQIPEGTTIFLY
jgi:hypothetical protein